ncbi:MAG: prealbumin-like fold domain-containing protein, partial [Gemmatimonadales bacterium]
MSWRNFRAAPLALLFAAFVWGCGSDQPDPAGPATSDVAPVFAIGGVGGAAFTTFNPAVDGDSKDVCKNSIINCNIYGAKEYVWLNGGPSANHLKPDGYYFFAVLEPGGQPNPNDQGGVLDKNLSDDFDLYTNRIFRTEGGEVIEYNGDHWLDSGNPTNGNGKNATRDPDGEPPFIRLFPYSDTRNPGGVYIMAICYLGDDFGDLQYPVAPRDCKYDAFKVKEGKVTYEFMLEGIKFEDLDADGVGFETGDPLLPGWTITIKGTGFAGEPIDETVTTGSGGAWMYSSPQYTFGPKDDVFDAELTVCEVVQPGWYQSFPSSVCYDVTIPPAAAAFVGNLDFGNFRPVDITAKKFYDRDQDGMKDPGESWIADFQFCLYVGDETSTTKVAAGDFVKDPDPACQNTDANGTVVWDNLLPGQYTVKEEDADYWIPTTVEFAVFMLYSGESGLAKFGNVAICDGLTPGYWSNWRNHYSEAQFLVLLEGTIASSIAEADDFLASVGCDGDDALLCMKRFLLANQLTLNLTMMLDLPNPDGAELYRACQLDQHPDVAENLGYWLDQALALL